MAARIDLTGQQFNEWTLIKFIPPEEREDKYKNYIGLCSCGIQRPVSGADVKSGKSKSCGHLTINFDKITLNKKYGHITPIEQIKNKYNNPTQKFKCQCDCGNEIIMPAKMIGKKKSCGCRFMENFDVLQDITGQKFGKLTVIKLSEKTNKDGKRQYWDCICECGNHCTVYRGHLKDGHTSSCGCINSKGEEYVAKFLTENNIEFKSQVKIDGIKDKKELPFDFGLYKNGSLIGLIEIQGKQHYNKELLYYSENLEKHDKIKKEKCLEMNIPLLELDYSGGYTNTNFKIFEEQIINFVGGEIYSE